MNNGGCGATRSRRVYGGRREEAEYERRQGAQPRPPEAGATSEARGFRRSRNGLRPYFRFAGDDR